MIIQKFTRVLTYESEIRHKLLVSNMVKEFFHVIHVITCDNESDNICQYNQYPHTAKSVTLRHFQTL